MHLFYMYRISDYERWIYITNRPGSLCIHYADEVAMYNRIYNSISKTVYQSQQEFAMSSRIENEIFPLI